VIDDRIPSCLTYGNDVVFHGEPGRATRESAYWSSGLMCCELRLVAFGRDTPSTWKRLKSCPIIYIASGRWRPVIRLVIPAGAWDVSSVVKPTSSVTWIMSIGTRQNTDGFEGIGLIPVSMRSGGEESIRRIGVARTSQVLRQGVTRAMRFSSFTAFCRALDAACATLVP
jgi:hypothetical protein